MARIVKAEAVVFWIAERDGYYCGVEDDEIVIKRHLVYAVRKGTTPPSAVRYLVRNIKKKFDLTAIPMTVAVIGPWTEP